MRFGFLDFSVLLAMALIVFWLFFKGEEPALRHESKIANQAPEYEENEEVDINPAQKQAVERPLETEAATPVVPTETLSTSLAQEVKKEKKKGPYGKLDESFISFDENGDRYITQLTKNGKHLVYHGDVLIGDAKDIGKFQGKVVKQGKAQRWSNGVIPFVVDESLPNFEDVMDAIEYLNLQTNIKLVPKKEQHKNFVHVTQGEMDCYSYAGMKGGKQEIYLTSRCGVREILHEFMHTIGFFHEQNRGDRDQYIQVLWENIEEDNHLQFKKIPLDFIGVRGRPFDFDSIMLYSSFNFSLSEDQPALLTKDGDIIPQSASLLSGEDIHRINTAYPQ